MLAEPFESENVKKWPQLYELVADLRKKVDDIMIKPPIAFKITNLFNSANEQIGVRLYALGSVNKSIENTLLYCDVMIQDCTVKNSVTCDISEQHLINDSNEDENLVLTTYKWHEILQIDSTSIDNETPGDKLLEEENLSPQRKSSTISSITSYEFHEKQRRFVFDYNGSLHYFDDNGQAPYLPIKLPSNKSGVKSSPKICPVNPNLVAYVCEDDLFCLNIETGQELQLTNNKLDEPNKKLMSGLSSYVIQEEFDRFVGLWWQPIKTDSELGDHYQILYEQVDETDVELLHVITSKGATEECRYAKSGKTNASSLLKLAKLKLDYSNKTLCDPTVELLNNISDLKHLWPDTEYLTNCAWLTSDTIVLELLSRQQKNLVVVLMSISGAFETQIIYEEINEYWVSMTHVCEFVQKEQNKSIYRAGDELSFIWLSSESGFQHLYQITVKLSETSNSIHDQQVPLRSSLLNKVQLTSGRWQVNERNVWLDNNNDLVYFVGLRDSPLEQQLYVLSLNEKQPEILKKLTTSGYSNSLIMFNSQCDLFINIQSSISKPVKGYLNKIQIHTNNRLPSSYRVGCLITDKIEKPDGTTVNCIEQFELLPGFSRPELFTYQLKDSGDIVYGLIYKPDFMQADKRYPCVLEVYGGPSVQLVTNTFKSGREFGRHLLASQGYIVCVMDCRGSANRGMTFSTHLNRRLGQVEVQDQVEVLQYLASTTNCIDLSRIAVYGYSYGGYLSLMCYATRPDIFKIAIAGASVTDWSLYDTGYTERYMDTRKNNPDGYAKGSILNLVSNFPNDEHRLLIMHGLNDKNVLLAHSTELIHKLVQSGKPYDLLVYPRQGHSFFNSQTHIHFLTSVLSYLDRNL